MSCASLGGCVACSASGGAQQLRLWSPHGSPIGPVRSCWPLAPAGLALTDCSGRVVCGPMGCSLRCAALRERRRVCACVCAPRHRRQLRSGGGPTLCESRDVCTDRPYSFSGGFFLGAYALPLTVYRPFEAGPPTLLPLSRVMCVHNWLSKVHCSNSDGFVVRACYRSLIPKLWCKLLSRGGSGPW